MDISESCYSQLQKIRNVSLNTELPDENNTMPTWKSKHVRLLKLTLTDGVQTIYGMEYEPIPALKEPFVPGFKVVIFILIIEIHILNNKMTKLPKFFVVLLL